MSKSEPTSGAGSNAIGFDPITYIVGRTLVISVLSVTFTLLTVASLKGPASAQVPPSFEIKVIPVSDHAVKGQPFTYTVAVTNVSSTPAANIAINIDIPDSTEFINTRHSSLKWYGGTPFSDPSIKVDQITLFTLDKIEANEVFVFDMIVEVLPDVDQAVVVEAYSVATLEGEILVSGSGLNTPVRAPTSTPRPTPAPSPTPIMTPTSISSGSDSGAIDTSGPQSPTATPEALTDHSSDQSGMSPAATSSDKSLENPVSSIAILAMIGVIFALIIIGIGWFVRRK